MYKEYALSEIHDRKKQTEKQSQGSLLFMSQKRTLMLMWISVTYVIDLTIKKVSSIASQEDWRIVYLKVKNTFWVSGLKYITFTFIFALYYLK